MARSRGPWRWVRRAARAWREEGALRLRLKNVGHLLTGNLMGSLVGLLAFALTARALGPADYGALALTHAYVRAIERLVSFQSWQPLIKYGAGLKDAGHQEDLKSLLKFGLVLDVAGAAAAWLVAIGLALVAAPWFGWTESTLALVLLYSTVLLFRVAGMPTAVLRLAGRFRLMAYGQVVTAVVRLLLCGAAFVLGGGLLVFASIWLVTQALGSLTSVGFAFRELHRQGVRGLLRAPLQGVTRRFPGLWNFAWSTNLSLTLRSSAQEFDTLIVGALADPAAAGLYHIAKRVGRLAQQVGVQVQAVLYPDMARLWAQRALVEFRRTVLQVEVLLAGFGLGAFLFFLVTAEPLLRWTAGPQFAGAAPLLIVQMLAVTMTLAGTALRSALLAMGRQQQVLSIVLLATVGFHATALVLIPQIGAMGANIGHVVLGTVWLVGLAMAFRRALRPEASQDLLPAAPAAALSKAEG
jgi:O-antigen/teichoic acid export membrane protein